MLTAEQKMLRLGRMSSSTVAAALGLHPTKTPFAAWEDITGRSAFQGNQATRRGEILEDAIVRIFEEEHPDFWCTPGQTVIGPEDWIVDTPDRIVCDRFGQCGVLEIKAVGPWNMTGWTLDAMPDHVQVQARWHMLATGTSQAWVVAFFNLQDVRTYRLERDHDLEHAILFAAHEWYQKHVVTDVPPPVAIDGSDESTRYARAFFKHLPDSREIEPESPEGQLLVQLRGVATERRRLEQEEASLRNQLALELKGDSVRMSGASFTLQHRKTVAWQKVARALNPSPELVDQFTTESASYVARFNGGSNE